MNRPLAIGCMRLSTEPGRDEDAAVAVLHAALDAGVTFLDTADAYCHDDTDRGHNERLIARALGQWDGDRSRIVVATKGGLTRPDGRWAPDGRAKHLTDACRRSREALGVERIDLYQLHAPDPRVPLATSVRALAALKRDGLIGGIGLCNVTVRQIEEARQIVEIDAVQVELSLWNDQHLLSGVVRYCLDNRLRLLAYRPFGGVKARARTAAHPALAAIAAEHGVTPFDIALAWLNSLADVVVPLPGPTRLETARAAAHHRPLTLSSEQVAQLDALCPAVRSVRHTSAVVSLTQRGDAGAEVVLIIGSPGAGKSTTANEFAGRGYVRLNRDEIGGTLRGLIPALDAALASGASRIVLDNTYPSRAARAAVIQAAGARGARVRCVWLETSMADAQVNAVTRMLARFGRLLDVEALAAHRKQDAAALAPSALFRFQRELEPPDVAEGFERVDVVPFERRADPSHVNRAVIVWCDGILLRSRSGARVPTDADDLDVDASRAATLRSYAERSFRLLGLSWQPEISEGTRTREDVDALFARLNERLGVEIEVAYCPHAAGPPTCWCRKPLPGLAVLFVERYGLDPAACVYVGEGPQDAGFAERLGFQYRRASDFFGAPGAPPPPAD